MRFVREELNVAQHVLLESLRISNDDTKRSTAIYGCRESTGTAAQRLSFERRHFVYVAAVRVFRAESVGYGTTKCVYGWLKREYQRTLGFTSGEFYDFGDPKLKNFEYNEFRDLKIFNITLNVTTDYDKFLCCNRNKMLHIRIRY